ncbi:conserved unknown protein [Ectocarpus siliculosus]|uniref:Uncharacterized protein n=1 Tax=Ectocarpus siliculosus TaxID=2880 RepID=D7G860_ECTSI|nr:conserved unknown protein [Ectocarpus siliculosus]|eukprot:CBJ27923.1 conserved unknown protein [Ectocarpus siliculosus]
MDLGGRRQMADMAWNIKCREEDMEFRRRELQWRQEEVWWRGVNDRKREVEEKAKQLEQVASLSALIAGFALVAMVEVGLMLLAMLSSTFMLVAIMKYDVKAKDRHYPSFQRFWASRCESDWRFSFRAFNIGIPLFMGVLAEVGWITLDDGSVAHRVAAGAISVIALLSTLIFYAYTYRKWGPFLSNAKLDLHIIQAQDEEEDEEEEDEEEEVSAHGGKNGGDGRWRRLGEGGGAGADARRAAAGAVVSRA